MNKKDDVLKICMILPKGLPVPSVKGGAIETLVNSLIDENENKHKLDIKLVCLYDKCASKLSKKYRYTEFIYIKKTLKYFIKSIAVRIKNIFGFHLNTYNEIILSKIKKINFDYIVVEDGAYHSFSSYLKYFKKEQMILHFHHVSQSDNFSDNVFGKFIGVSDYVKNEFKKNSKIPNFLTVRNGIDVKQFKQSISKQEFKNLRSKYSLDLSDFVIVYCGRLVPYKGVMELIQAVNNINDPKIKLLIIGSINFAVEQTSPFLEKIEEYIKDSNERIKLTGFVDNKEIYKYYKISNLGVVPSTYEDAATLVTVEMMASGLANVITNSGGIPEFASSKTVIVKKEKNLVKNLQDAILMFYNDSDKLEKAGRENIKIAEQYTIENFYNNFVNALKEDGERNG